MDIIGDAGAERYSQALSVLMDSDELDAILVLHSPSALGESTTIADALIETVKQHPKRNRVSILTNWSGEDAAYRARKHFSKAGIPTYRTPEGACAPLCIWLSIAVTKNCCRKCRNLYLTLSQQTALPPEVCCSKP